MIRRIGTIAFIMAVLIAICAYLFQQKPILTLHSFGMSRMFIWLEPDLTLHIKKGSMRDAHPLKPVFNSITTEIKTTLTPQQYQEIMSLVSQLPKKSYVLDGFQLNEKLYAVDLVPRGEDYELIKTRFNDVAIVSIGHNNHIWQSYYYAYEDDVSLLVKEIADYLCECLTIDFCFY